MYNKTKRNHKNYIMDSFYKICDFEGDIILLAGPNFKRNIDRCLTLNPNSITSYELDNRTYSNQMKSFSKYFSKNPRVSMVYDSIETSDPVEFIDADLMSTFKSDGKIITSLLNKQVNWESPNKKVFIGTIATRNAGKKETFLFIENLLSQIGWVKILDQIQYKFVYGRNSYTRKYITRCDSFFEKFELYTYSDGQGPMITFKIEYN